VVQYAYSQAQDIHLIWQWAGTGDRQPVDKLQPEKMKPSSHAHVGGLALASRTP
jgi:hypothetical protein